MDNGNCNKQLLSIIFHTGKMLLDPVSVPTISGFYDSVSIEKLYLKDNKLMIEIQYTGRPKKKFQVVTDRALSEKQTKMSKKKSLVFKVLRGGRLGQHSTGIVRQVLCVNIEKYAKRGYRRFVVQ
jgi:hypothetical protein